MTSPPELQHANIRFNMGQAGSIIIDDFICIGLRNMEDGVAIHVRVTVDSLVRETVERTFLRDST